MKESFAVVTATGKPQNPTDPNAWVPPQPGATTVPKQYTPPFKDLRVG